MAICGQHEKKYYGGENELHGGITNQDKGFTKNCAARYSNVTGLVEMKLHRALTLIKLTGIVLSVPWYTAGQKETGGDDSITYRHVGSKK